MHVDRYKKIILSSEYELVLANLHEFSVCDAVYGDGVYNRFIPRSWEIRLEISQDNPFESNGNYFFILSHGKRIGGVFLAPHTLARFFTIPPFVDAKSVLQLILQWRVKNFDVNTKMVAYQVAPSHFELFDALGFVCEARRRWMMRPTEKMQYYFPNQYRFSNDLLGSSQEIQTLFQSCFKDTTFAIELSEEVLIQEASTLLYNEAGRLIGACIISEMEGWPLVHTIGVDEDYRGQGLATQMLNRVLALLWGKYDALLLYVTIGNPAEKVYFDTGFLLGTEFRKYTI